MIIFNIAPIPKPRMTRSDKWKKRPIITRYYNWCNAIRAIASVNKFILPPVLNIEFHIPFPKSYSKKKKETLLNKPHQIRPDLDNLVKAFCDALTDEDGYVYEIHAKKVWGNTGRIHLNQRLTN